MTQTQLHSHATPMRTVIMQPHMCVEFDHLVHPPPPATPASGSFQPLHDPACLLPSLPRRFQDNCQGHLDHQQRPHLG